MDQYVRDLITTWNIQALYHFTPKKNWLSIKDNGGLFCLKHLAERGIMPSQFLSSRESRVSDARSDMAKYVHLSIDKRHAMLERAMSRVCNDEVVLITVKPEALGLPNVSFTKTMANRRKTGVHPISSFNLWMQECSEACMTGECRNKDTRRPNAPCKLQYSEILIPDSVPLSMILGWEKIRPWHNVPCFSPR